MTRHANRRYIIFGADGDTGRAVGKLLGSSGAETMLVGGPGAFGWVHAGSQTQQGSRLSIDATSSAQVGKAFDAAAQELGSIDGVVHCVGSFDLEPIERISDDSIDSTIAVNLTSAILVGREIARRYKLAPGFSAVFVSSAAAQRGMPNQEVLSAAKGGVEALVRSLASTLAPGVRVNGVAPGLIATSLTEPLRSDSGQAERSKAMFAAERFGDCEQIADTVAFLLDPTHTFVTGQVWCVDGGLTRVQVKPKEQVDTSSYSMHRSLEEQRQFAEFTTT